MFIQRFLNILIMIISFISLLRIELSNLYKQSYYILHYFKHIVQNLIKSKPKLNFNKQLS